MQWPLRCLGFLFYLGSKGKPNWACSGIQTPNLSHFKVSALHTACCNYCSVSTRHWLSCALFCSYAELIDPCRSLSVGFTIASPSAWNGLLQSVCLYKSDFFWKTTFNLLWEGFRHGLLPTWKLILSLTGLSEPASTVCSQSPFLKLEAKPPSFYIPLAPVPWLPNSYSVLVNAFGAEVLSSSLFPWKKQADQKLHRTKNWDFRLTKISGPYQESQTIWEIVLPLLFRIISLHQ